MKKILTFLVMLFVTVSVAVGQQESPVYFNYQAVVRDMTDHHALYHDKENLQVNIKIYDAPGQEIPRYSETHTGVKTNHNGMVTLLVGKGTPADADATLYDVDWRNAFIESEFVVEGKTISMVQTQITAVPLALQAEGPMQLTTQQIVNYILNGQPETFLTDGDDVEAIIDALNQNSALKEYIKERVMNYMKNHKAEAKELALYFIGLVDPEDIEEAEDALSQDSKDKILAMIVQFAKDHKSAAMEILKSYIQTTDQDEVEEIYNAVPSEIKTWAIDKVIEYIKNHPELAREIAKAYYDAATVNDVVNIHEYISSHNEPVYSKLVEIFNQYLLDYLTENHYLQACAPDYESFCSVVERVKSLENAIKPEEEQGGQTPTVECNGFAEGTEILLTSTAEGYTISVILKNAIPAGNNDNVTAQVTQGGDPDKTYYLTPSVTASTHYEVIIPMSEIDSFSTVITIKVNFNSSEACSDSKTASFPLE